MVADEKVQVGILIFDDAEVLDFCGPFEVFSVAGYVEGRKPFTVSLVAEKARTVVARNGLKLTPDYTFQDCPPMDVLVVTGGPGARAESRNRVLIDWLVTRVLPGKMVLSVCTASLILGRAGLLDGLRVTSHHRAFEELREAAPTAFLDEEARYIWNDDLLVAAGVTSGIDASLEMVKRYCGEAIAVSTAKYMEFPWERVSS